MDTRKEMKIYMEREAHTDVMYVDICRPSENSVIDVIDLGDKFGLPPGQFLARVSREDTELIGFTIHRFSSFNRTLKWKFRVLSARRAILLLVDAVIAGIRASNQSRNRTHVGACTA